MLEKSELKKAKELFHLNKLNEKGQAVATDLLLGTTVFFAVFAILSGIWINNAGIAVSERSFQELEAKAVQTAEFLVKVQGIPYNWQSQAIEEVNAIGLARKERVLDEKKVEKLQEWSVGGNYSKLKEIMNVEGFEFYFKVSEFEGGFESSDNYNSIAIERFIVMNGVVEKFEFRLFKKK